MAQGSNGSEGRALVVTGSSAGGIEVLSTLVSTLSAEFRAPVVVAQHLDPNFKSRLGEILGGRSRLPVKVVETQETMQPGTIYVVPSGCDVEISDGSVAVKRSPSQKRVKPSVDRLFRTAAKAYGESLIAVILSGMGNDGVAGAREVKERGGTVIVQEPSTAEYPSMPLALPPMLVDFSRKAEGIGPLIEELVAQPYVSVEHEEQALRSLLSHVRDRSGIDFLQYKMPTIRRRLVRLMADAGSASFEEYQRYLDRNPEAYQRLVSSFLIKVTGFFRDAQLYEFLRDRLLPQLIESARSADRELRLWSAGCATGEEAYSLAILVAELARKKNENVDARIFATDLDEEAVTFARRGIYARDALEDVPGELVERYFTHVGDAYEVGKRIRNMTIFGQHDLGQRAPFPRIDLVLCRNVLIYFTKELQQHALQLFEFSLRNGGFLALGKTETTSPASEFFKPVNATLKIFERQGNRVPIPRSRIRETYAPPSQPLKQPAFHAGAPPALVPRVHPTSNEFIGNFIFNSPIGVVVVDRRYDIVAINRAARSLLNVHGIGVGEDLIHMATAVESNALREIIDAVLRGEEGDVTSEVAVRGAAGEADRYVHVAAYPDKAANGNGTRVEAVILVMADVTSLSRARREMERHADEQGAKLATLRDRSEELAQRQRMLLEANDELTTANLELRSVNEQLLISLEEAASSTEEIETLNEEMQATNEELETLNEELQATVEELNTTNDELEARGRGLEDAGKVREAALHGSELSRASFEAALNCIEEPIALLSADGLLVFRNGALEKYLDDLRLQAGNRSLAITDLPNAEVSSEKPLRATAKDGEGNEWELEARMHCIDVDGATRWLVVFHHAAKR